MTIREKALNMSKADQIIDLARGINEMPKISRRDRATIANLARTIRKLADEINEAFRPDK